MIASGLRLSSRLAITLVLCKRHMREESQVETPSTAAGARDTTSRTWNKEAQFPAETRYTSLVPVRIELLRKQDLGNHCCTEAVSLPWENLAALSATVLCQQKVLLWQWEVSDDPVRQKAASGQYLPLGLSPRTQQNKPSVAAQGTDKWHVESHSQLWAKS